MFSNITAVGRLGRDPEMKYTEKGHALTSFSMAVDSGYGDRKETSWFRVTLFGKAAENATEWLKKGNLVLVAGECKARQYTGNDGVERTSVEITASSFRNLSPRDEDVQAKREQAQSAVGALRDQFNAPDDLEDVPW